MFFAISIIEFIFFVYYKFLVISTGTKSKKRSKIIGNMKDPDDWRRRNNIVAFISLFWAFVSIIAFIYLKFFYKTGLVSVIYVFVFLVVVVASVAFFIKKNKVVSSK